MKKIVFALISSAATLFSLPFAASAQTSPLTSSTGLVASIVNAPNDIELRDKKGKLLHIFKHELVEGAISSMAFSPDGKLIASAAKTGGWPFRVRNEDWPSILGEVRLWDTQTGKLQHVLIEPKAQMRVVTFTPDGKMLAVGGGDGKIRFWDVITGKVKAVIPTSFYVLALDFSPDGEKLVAALGDKKVRVWSVRTKKIWKVLDAEDLFHKSR